MYVIETISQIRQARSGLEGSVGLVPTMGYLHAGHLSLVAAARQANDSVVATIFVNPTQFGPTEDVDTYPRDLQRDLELLEAQSVDIVFAPGCAEVYPDGFSSTIDVGPIAERLEGASRVGHFRGVATIVAKLFNIVRPTRAYFGQKDAQQCAVIRKMVADLNFDVEVVVCPTVREADGLAMSSRNVYLSNEERIAARVLSAALLAARSRYLQGEYDAQVLRDMMAEMVNSEPLARLDYVSVADSETMDELSRLEAPEQKPGSHPAIASLAVRIGRARLIDNVILT